MDTVHDWQPATELAHKLGVTSASIYSGASQGLKVNGFEILSSEAAEDEAERWGVKKVFRAAATGKPSELKAKPSESAESPPHSEDEPAALPITQWQPPKMLAAALGVHRRSISKSVERGTLIAGHAIERRRRAPSHSRKWPRLQYVYRVMKIDDPVVESIHDWQTRESLARRLGVSASHVGGVAAGLKHLAAGHPVESREVSGPEEAVSHGTTQRAYLYRVPPEEREVVDTVVCHDGDDATQGTPRESWAGSKREGESSKAFQAFAAYRDLGPCRSLPKVCEALGKKQGYVKQLERWSSKYDWVARAAEWDAEMDLRRTERRLLGENVREPSATIDVEDFLARIQEADALREERDEFYASLQAVSEERDSLRADLTKAMGYKGALTRAKARTDELREELSQAIADKAKAEQEAARLRKATSRVSTLEAANDALTAKCAIKDTTIEELRRENARLRAALEERPKGLLKAVVGGILKGNR